ncbi:J domain-containing protein [Cyanobacterium sp. uoEpiScrs1]|uniref:J domain-containing protein n=1 Tax=Cyanobacterium sp. uoEpiScrs1 TaxID=2976343 RepID=UPI00226A26CB|nr:J domain-containing protein [Cyanobacterium sp. uoEpiScrs1]
MNFLTSIGNVFQSLLLFIFIFCGICWLLSPPKPPTENLNFQFRRLTCLLEDAPQSSLRGQAYPLASSLMTPLTCLLEDAPQSSLHGQAYPLASPLMTPLSCIWEKGWYTFYRQSLAKPGVNYWEWKNFPLATESVPELFWLWRLPEPKKASKLILESLAKEDQSFWNQETINGLRQWHHQATQSLGLSKLKTIYQVFYGMPWIRLQPIVSESPLPLNYAFFDESSPWWKVFNLNPFPTSLQVEHTYKSLIRLWHPDQTQHPLAHYVTARLNSAYGEYQLRQKRNSQKLGLVQQWFKSRFSS